MSKDKEPKISDIEKLINHFRNTDREHELHEILERHDIKNKDEVMDVIDDDTHEFHEEAIVINKIAWSEGLIKKTKKPFKRMTWLFRNKWYVRFGVYWALLFIFIFSVLNAPIYITRFSSVDDTIEPEPKVVTTQELVGGQTAKSAPLSKGEKIPSGSYIKIPKLKINAPIKFPKSTSEKVIQNNLKSGVVHYYGTAKPGEIGNTFITGHSSNFWWIDGKYNYIFVNLDKLVKGDQVIIYHGGNKYVYTVKAKLVVTPKDTSVLEQTDIPMLSLMTCTPPGTNWKRLVVQLNQTAPKYVKPKVVTKTTVIENTVDSLPSTDTNSLGGWLKTLWDSLFFS